MLPITTAFYASLHKYSVIVILGILPLLQHLILTAAISNGYVSLLQLLLSS